jgi:hypothetical protein
MNPRNDGAFFNREFFEVAILGLFIVAEKSQFDGGLREGSAAAENQNSDDR